MKQLELNFAPPADPKADWRQACADKQEAKQDRLIARADKAQRNAAAARGSAQRIMDAIAMGQPILVGHHSERRHRRDLKRLRRNTRTQIDEQNKANQLLARANDENTDISSDDPEKHSARIAELEERRAQLKAFNEEARAQKKEAHPSYVLQNPGANIRRLKGRVAELETKEAQPERAPQVFEGLRIEEDKDDNRIRLIFMAKPDKETRQKLRGLGFVWAPSQGAWQQKLDERSRYRAQSFALTFADPSSCIP